MIIPGLYHGKSTQFFFGYQHTIANQISTASSTVPTLAEEGRTATGLAPYADLGNLCKTGFDASGNCTTASQQVRNPFTNVLYPFNRIPSSAFDPASVNYQSHFPTATSEPAPDSSATRQLSEARAPVLRRIHRTRRSRLRQQGPSLRPLLLRLVHTVRRLRSQQPAQLRLLLQHALPERAAL